jgi:hypothetical protein
MFLISRLSLSYLHKCFRIDTIASENEITGDLQIKTKQKIK